MSSRSFGSGPRASVEQLIAEHGDAIATYQRLNELAAKRLNETDQVDIKAIQSAKIEWNNGAILHHERARAYLIDDLQQVSDSIKAATV